METTAIADTKLVTPTSIDVAQRNCPLKVYPNRMSGRTSIAVRIGYKTEFIDTAVAIS